MPRYFRPRNLLLVLAGGAGTAVVVYDLRRRRSQQDVVTQQAATIDEATPAHEGTAAEPAGAAPSVSTSTGTEASDEEPGQRA